MDKTKFRWGRAVANLDDVEAAVRAGFDAAEFSVTTLMELSDSQFRDTARNLRRLDISLEVFNSPLPPGLRVTEEGFNIYSWGEYLSRALGRVAETGCRILVWNDGRSRVMPMEGPAEAAKRQTLQFLYILSDLANKSGIRVLVEPLGPRHTNFLNTVTEVDEFLTLAGRSNLSSAISLRDLDTIGLDLMAIDRRATFVSHAYMEFPDLASGSRIAPGRGDGFDYRPFLQLLSEIGYRGVITLPSDADAASLKFCRSLHS